MSQAALWHVMNMFHIPDVDLLDQIYDSATVRLAPNDAEGATITFDTGVAQGSITSPQLLNIFINALLWMLTATGQNQGLSHGLKIGKDQDDSSQDADHGYQFNNIGFIDDSSIFSETQEGMQTLLDVVQEFTTWEFPAQNSECFKNVRTRIQSLSERKHGCLILPRPADTECAS